MIPTRILLGSALALPAVALAIAGCGGGSSGGTPAASVKPSTQHGGTTVDVRSTGLGKILVDSQGRTLYLFEKDTGAKSTCFGACASAWPPLRTSGRPKAGKGVKASLLGTTARSDGNAEVTYNGHPLYYYAGDQQAGNTNGEGLTQFGAEWYVLSPSGNKVEGTASGSASSPSGTDSSTNTGGGSSGY
jgi:predicted lipoprotein with Yx(FWY)xxD motif